MTLARPIVPGKTYLLTRRCTQREILLTPSRILNNIFLFCLAWIAGNCKVEVHAMCVLGNHYHMVVTDPEGRLPEFMQELNKYTAKCINALRNRRENLWAAEQPNIVELEEDDDVLDKVLYTLANPVSSMLVQRGDMWPGVRLGPEQWGQNITVQRPDEFFRADSPVPTEVTLRMKRPPIYSALNNSILAGVVAGELEAREQELRRKAKLERKSYLGVDQVKREVMGARPKSPRQPRGIKPRVAAKDRWRRMEALRRLKDWLTAYRDAYFQWRKGDQDIVFPAGTYALRLRAGVPCVPFASG